MIQSLARSLRVIEAVADSQPVGVSELARIVDLPKSTVQRILVTAASEGWLDVESGPPVQWIVGDKLRHLAHKEFHSNDLRELALATLTRLRDSTDETAHLAVPQGKQMVLIERLDSRQSVRAVNEIGSLTPMAATSTGLAILSHYDDERLARFIEEGLEKHLDTTIVDPAAFQEQIRIARAEGVAIVHDQYRPNIVAIGSAIIDRSGEPVAAVSISMPTFRYDDSQRQHFSDLVRDGAREITERLSR